MIREWGKDDAKHKELDELYDRALAQPGWLSYLLDAKAIDDVEADYLIWRDDCAAPVRQKQRIWEAQIESHGGLEIENSETSEEQLAAVTNESRRLIPLVKISLMQLPKRCASWDAIGNGFLCGLSCGWN